MSDRDNGHRRARIMIYTKKIYYIRGHLLYHCLRRLSLSVQTVLSVKAKWFLVPDCSGGLAGLKSGGCSCAAPLKPYSSILRAVFCTVKAALCVCVLLFCFFLSQPLHAVISQWTYDDDSHPLTSV